MTGPRRIAVDGHMLGSREAGNASYVAGLLEGLEAAGHSVHVFAPRAFAGLSASHTYHPLSLQANGPRLALGLPFDCLRHRIELIHLTYHAPVYSPCPYVLTVHDLAFRRFPALYRPRDRLLLNTLLPWSARRARAVLTGSEAARRDLVRFDPSLEGKVSVIPYAASAAFRPATPEAQAALCRSYGIRPPYALALGRPDPRKNLGRVIEAWRMVRARVDCRLVLAGEAGVHVERALEPLAAERASGEVLHLGFVPADDLAGLYAAAACLVYPSLYEGFGLPVLEAMACGTPVVTSNVSALPEVAGDAALYVDPYDTAGLAGALEQVLCDPALATNLRDRGLERASRFSWQETARRTWEVYETTW